MLKFNPQSGEHEFSDPCLCSFGITESVVALAATALTSVGVGAGTAAAIAPFAAGALGGAGIGAAGSAIEGGNPLTGALTGGLTGGVTAGLGGPLGGALGIGTTGGDILAGAGAGALGSAITGQNPLMGTLEGAGSGLVSGALSGSGGSTPGPAGTSTGAGTGGGITGGPGPGAAAITAPPGADIYTGGAGSGLGDSVLNAGDSLASGATSGFNPGGVSNPELGGVPGAGASGPGVGFTGGGTGNPELNVPITGTTDLSPTSQAAVGNQLSLSGGTNDAGLSISDRVKSLFSGTGGDVTGTGGSPAGSGFLSPNGNPELNVPSGAVAATPNVTTETGLGGAAGGATGGGTGNSIVNAFENPTGSNILAALGKNSNLLVPAALYGYEALSKPSLSSIPGYSNLTSEAAALGNQGTQLSSYLSSGTLPPGIQTALNQAAQSAQATIRSQYAARGMTGSSAEAQDLAGVQNRIVSQGADIAQQLLNSGVQESNLSSQLYSKILQANLSQDQELSSALASLAGAAAKPSITLSA